MEPQRVPRGVSRSGLRVVREALRERLATRSTTTCPACRVVGSFARDEDIDASVASLEVYLLFTIVMVVNMPSRRIQHTQD